MLLKEILTFEMVKLYYKIKYINMQIIKSVDHFNKKAQNIEISTEFSDNH